MDKLKSIYSSAYSAVITILTVTAITVAAELSAEFKNWLAGFSGHHWVTKSYISLIVFALFFVFFFSSKKSVSDDETRKLLAVLQVFAVLGFIVVLAFYIYEFFSH